MKPNILIIKELPEEKTKELRDKYSNCTLHVVPGPEEARQYIPTADVLAGFISGDLMVEVLDGPNQLKWVQSWSAGVNQYPQDRLQSSGIYLTSTSGIHQDQISEIALAAIIMLERRFIGLFHAQGKEAWVHFDDVGTIHHKTVTILGAGTIGTELARLCKAFHMRTIAVNRSGEAQTPWDEAYTLDDLKSALAPADYVINILPETDATRYALNAETFAYMKKGSGYINVGRGATTDTEALIQALDQDHLRGAVLDVFEEEPLPKGHPLWKHPKVFIMPHHAGADVQYDEKALEIFQENLDAYLKDGAPIKNVVDYEAGY